MNKMTTEQAKKYTKLINALAEGEIIQYKFRYSWIDFNNNTVKGMLYYDTDNLRIKPASKFRHYNWREMCGLKPLEVVLERIADKKRVVIVSVDRLGVCVKNSGSLDDAYDNEFHIKYEDLLNDYVWTNNKPCGIEIC